jgi:hypothetical protein
MPKADAGLTRPATSQNADAGLTLSRYYGISAFRHLLYIWYVNIIKQFNTMHLQPCIDVQGVPLSSFLQFLKMPKCRTVRHPVSPVTEWKRMPMPKPVRYRNKGTHSGIQMPRYQTEMSETGMPMPAASGLSPMPSYDMWWLLTAGMHTHMYMLHLRGLMQSLAKTNIDQICLYE